MVWVHVWMEHDGVSVNADEGRRFPFPFLIIFFVKSIYEGDQGMKESQKEGETRASCLTVRLCSAFDPQGWFPTAVIVVQFQFAGIQQALSLWGTHPRPVGFQGLRSIDGPPHFLCCCTSLHPPPPPPLPHHLLNKLFSSFYIAVFYHFGSFCLCDFYSTVPCLYSSLSAVCEVQRWLFFWLVKATVCLLQRGGAFVSVLTFLPAPLFLTHISTHSNIAQPPLMYLCWYFVNNKRRKKGEIVGCLSYSHYKPISQNNSGYKGLHRVAWPSAAPTLLWWPKERELCFSNGSTCSLCHILCFQT